MNILLTTGIFPPQIGGPAQYAKELREHWIKDGHSVSVLTYKLERLMPVGIRHFWFFLRTVFSIINTDFVIALDTFSVGVPSIAASKLFGKKIIVRTGGDFLWEGYIERTGDLVKLKDFYKTRLDKLNLKEKIIYHLTTWSLRLADVVIFSTEWQRNIFTDAYGLNPNRCKIVENYYGKKIESLRPEKKVFIGATRPWKGRNLDTLKKAFSLAQREDPALELDLENARYEVFLEKIKRSYAVIVVSISDISPNMILDSIRMGKPFIVTEEVGIKERIKEVAVFADPLNMEDIKSKIIFLADPTNYERQLEKISSFDFSHGWEEIAKEIVEVAKHVKSN